MSEETWDQKYERECKESSAKAEKMLAKYEMGDKKKLSDETDKNGRVVEFLDGITDNDKERVTRTTRFQVLNVPKNYKYGRFTMHKGSEKRQKFYVVNGPLAGQRITDENEDYVLYNCAGFNRCYRTKNDGGPPRCVLVHKSAFGK